MQRINETKSWFLEKINEIEKLQANLAKLRREKAQINKNTNEKVEITTEIKEICESLVTTLKTYIQVNW
jgi:small-conductance mechanosensitive channel